MTGGRGISDTVGVLLIAVGVLSTTTVVGVAIVEYQTAQAPSDITVAISASTDGANLTVHHLGGSAVPAGELEIVSRSASTVQRFPGRNATIVRGDSDGSFEPGERWRWTGAAAFGNDLTVFLVDASSNTKIDTATIREPTTTPPATTPTDGSAPTANFTISNHNPSTGETIEFDAAPSNDPDGSIVSYEWDLDGDGSWDTTGQTVTRQYENSGPVAVRLRVVDTDGRSASRTRTIQVENQDPSLSVDSSCTDLTCSFTANASDPDGSITSIEWRLGDGTTADGPSITHEYATGGEYVVTATATDDTGATVTATTTVTPDGNVVFDSGEAVTTGWNGKKTAVQIDLTNRRESAVSVVAVSVSVSKQNVNAVYEDEYGTGPFESEFYWETTHDGFVESGYADAYVTGTRIEMDQTPTIASGDEATVTVAEFGRVRTRCLFWVCWEAFRSKNVPGATVTFEIWLDDGTQRTFEFKA